MERTESNIVQVAPDYENEKIREMEAFGWSLQNRQEIHEQGDAYGRPSLIGSDYIIKTSVQKYVKLHFARSLSLPNLDAIKALEAQYNNLSYPDFPRHFPTIASFFDVRAWWWYYKHYKRQQGLAEVQLQEFLSKRDAIRSDASALL